MYTIIIITTGLGNSILGNTLNAVFVIVVVLVLLYALWGGNQWIMSSGDKQKIAAARNRIIYAVIGLVIVLLAIPLINLFLLLFGRPQLGSMGTGSGGPGTICPVDMSFSENHIPAGCECPQGVPNQNGECDADGKPSCPLNTPYDLPGVDDGWCSCSPNTHNTGSQCSTS